jgi:hypothetical protein
VVSKVAERYEYELAQVKEAAQNMAERLRSAADDLEREINRIDQGDMKHAGMVDRASWAVNSLMYLIPALDPGTLMVKAARAEEWRLRAMYEEVSA